MYNLSLQIQRQWDDRFRWLITSLWSWIQWRSEHSKSLSPKPDLSKSTRLIRVLKTFLTSSVVSLKQCYFMLYFIFLVVYVIFYEIFKNVWGNWKSLSQVLEICIMVLKKKKKDNHAQVYRYFFPWFIVLLTATCCFKSAVSTNVICVNLVF